MEGTDDDADGLEWLLEHPGELLAQRPPKRARGRPRKEEASQLQPVGPDNWLKATEVMTRMSWSLSTLYRRLSETGRDGKPLLDARNELTGGLRISEKSLHQYCASMRPFVSRATT